MLLVQAVASAETAYLLIRDGVSNVFGEGITLPDEENGNPEKAAEMAEIFYEETGMR